MRRIALWVLPAMAALAVAATGWVYLAPRSATEAALLAERTIARLERREAVLPSGLRYVWLEGGSGEPLLLLHGFAADKDNFTRVARHLTPHFRVIVPDHIGFGESSRPAGADYRADAQVARLRELMRHLGVARVHLGGSSMGGQIAMAYAARHRDEVASLWLIDAAGIWSAPRSELARLVLEQGRNPLIARNEREFAEMIDFVMSDPPWLPRPVIDVMAQDRIRNASLSQDIFRQIATDSVEERVRGLRTPALIVWGEEDRAIHVETASILRRLLPASDVIVMPGVGHLPMLERPRRSAEDYLAFRQRIARPSVPDH